jgi:hypothetical protein
MVVPSDLIRARSVPITAILPPGLRRAGKELVGACPTCGGVDRFAVNPAKAVFNCRGCGACGDVIELARLLRGCDFPSAVTWLTGEAPQSGDISKSTSTRPAAKRQTSASWLQLWDQAQDPVGTPVVSYLAHRGVLDVVPDGALGEVLRFHPACKFGLTVVPCLVALVRSIVTNEPQGLMRTALSPDGRKITIDGIDRRALGQLKNGAVKLTSDDMVTLALGIAEGVETALSMRLAPEFGPSPIWSVLCAEGIRNFPVLPGVECLWIGTDNDANGAGQSAAAECSDRWTAAGVEVRRVIPNAVGDLNDVVVVGGDR